MGASDVLIDPVSHKPQRTSTYNGTDAHTVSLTVGLDNNNGTECHGHGNRKLDGQDYELDPLFDPPYAHTVKEHCHESTEPSPLPDTRPTTATTGWKRYIGIFLAVLASICFSLAILIVKLLPNIHAFSFGVWRFLGILVPSAPLLLIGKLRDRNLKIFDTVWPLTEPEKRKTFLHLILRCVLGCCAIVLQYYSLNYMDIADSTVIVFSTPCFVTLFAWIFLGESCGIIPVIAAFCSLLGVTVICRPPILQGQSFNQQLLIGIALSFIAMICATIVFIVLRCLRKTNVGLITSTFGLIGLIQCSILCASIQRFDIPQNAREWFLVLGVAGLSFCGQTVFTCALRFEQASAISLVRSCDVIFAFIWQYAFLSVRPDLWSLGGSLLVVLSVFLVGLRKWVGTLKEEQGLRRRLWFLLK